MGLSLLLPFDSCCLVSLVSQKHAAHIAHQDPNLKFTKLEQHTPVSAPGPTSNLQAVGIMEVPIVWGNGRSVIFTMLVVSNLTWPILFWQNHLRKTDARIYSKDLKVYFADSAMNFEISCYDSNPLLVFTSMTCQDSVPPASSANITCLVTLLPKSSGGSQPVLLRIAFLGDPAKAWVSCLGGPRARETPSQWTAGRQHAKPVDCPHGTPSQWPASPPDPSCKLAKNKLTPSPTHKPPLHKTPRHATCPQLRRAPRWGVAPAKKRLWPAPRRGCENHALCHHKILPQKNCAKNTRTPAEFSEKITRAPTRFLLA